MESLLGNTKCNDKDFRGTTSPLFGTPPMLTHLIVHVPHHHLLNRESPQSPYINDLIIKLCIDLCRMASIEDEVDLRECETPLDATHHEFSTPIE